MYKLLSPLACIFVLSVGLSADAAAATKKPTKQEIAQREEIRKADDEKRKSDEDALKAEEEARKKFVDGAKSVVKAYKKLQYKIESGINYASFRQAVSEAHVEYKMFLDSPEGRYKAPEKYSDFASIVLADMDYSSAMSSWGFMIQNSGNYGYDKTMKEQTMDGIRKNWKDAAASIAKAEDCLNK